jgi:hypothetical protein
MRRLSLGDGDGDTEPVPGLEDDPLVEDPQAAKRTSASIGNAVLTLLVGIMPLQLDGAILLRWAAQPPSLQLTGHRFGDFAHTHRTSGRQRRYATRQSAHKADDGHLWAALTSPQWACGTS